MGKGSNVVTFEQFVRYWDSQHPSSHHQHLFPPDASVSTLSPTTTVGEARSKKRQHYQARFKFLMAKVRGARSFFRPP
jgi:hypothetical protein